MKTIKAGSSLAAGLAMTDLTLDGLWLRYFALGGSCTRRALEAYVNDGGHWNAHEHDVAAHALNECLMDQGMDHPVLYAGDLPLTVAPSGRAGPA
jgi:hypothetical protein